MRVAVKHEAVADLIARIALTTRAIEKELETLDTQAARLTSSWDGATQEAFERAYAEWSAAIQRMKAVLVELNHLLIRANALSMETSATVAKLWT